MTSILLASQSPRRAQLLEQIGVRFRVQAVDVDEAVLAGESPDAYVLRLARLKARAGAGLGLDLPVLAADTCVTLDGEIFGKPQDQNHAHEMLSRLSGRTHQVYTGLCLSVGGESHCRLQGSDVRFRRISADEIHNYWASGEPRDKAGGYAIQGLGAVFVQHLAGSYSGVMGLPLFETAELLRTLGINCFVKR